MTSAIIAGIALAWGFAEATLFFIVVDVLITYVTVYFGMRRGVETVFFATIGAVAGGAAMYHWGGDDPAGMVAALDERSRHRGGDDPGGAPGRLPATGSRPCSAPPSPACRTRSSPGLAPIGRYRHADLPGRQRAGAGRRGSWRSGW